MATYTSKLNQVLDSSGNLELSKLELRLMHMQESDFTVDTTTNDLKYNGQVLSSSTDYAFGYDGTDWVPLDASTANMGALAQKTYVDSKINDLVGNAPAALNTLGKIKEAMNDDKNYAYGVRDFISRQRLQVFEGDGIRDQFCIAAPWLPLHKTCRPPKADKVDVWLNGIKLKSQIVDPSNRESNLTTGYDYRLFGESPEYEYYDLRANPAFFTEENNTNADQDGWPMNLGGPALWMGGFYTYDTTSTSGYWYEKGAYMYQDGVSHHWPSNWRMRVHPFMNINTKENPVFRKRTKLHYGAFGKMYDRNPIEWSLNEDRQKHFNYGYSDWSWFRNGDIVNGKFFGANGAGTGDLYALNAEKDTMTAFTHFWNWNGDLNRLEDPGTREFTTNTRALTMNYVAHLQQSVDYHPTENPNPGPFRYEGFMPVFGGRNHSNSANTKSSQTTHTGSDAVANGYAAQNIYWPDDTVHICKHSGGWQTGRMSTPVATNEYVDGYSPTTQVGGLPVGTVYYDDGMLDWGGYRNFNYYGNHHFRMEESYSQWQYSIGNYRSTLDHEYAMGGGENGGYTRVHRLTPNVDKNDYVYGIRLAPHLAPLEDGDKLIVRTY
tara:strand:- start:4660 stop:6474 length:1815 start_codon:yes stop_codon:yes gene_type:complete